jgi:hypothetical protein
VALPAGVTHRHRAMAAWSHWSRQNGPSSTATNTAKWSSPRAPAAKHRPNRGICRATDLAHSRPAYRKGSAEE